MSHKPNTLESVVLAIDLLRRIPKTHKTTARQLHQELRDAGYERDLRTIQRQLDLLSEHFDIERDDRSKPYGYRWKERSRGLSLPTLSRQESLLLTLAEQQLQNLLPAGLMKSMDNFFTQARSQLETSASAEQERQWLDKVKVVSETQPLLPPTIEPTVFDAVTEALYENRLLKVDYQNSRGRRRQAKVMPLGLAQQGPRLYLVCRYQGYQDERILALNRIQWAEVSTMSFKPPPDFDMARYVADGHFGFGEGNRIRLEFSITHEAGLHLLESPLSRDQQAEDQPEGYKITATVVDSAQLDWWLQGFGDEVWDISWEEIQEK